MNYCRLRVWLLFFFRVFELFNLLHLRLMSTKITTLLTAHKFIIVRLIKSEQHFTKALLSPQPTSDSTVINVYCICIYLWNGHQKYRHARAIDRLIMIASNWIDRLRFQFNRNTQSIELIAICWNISIFLVPFAYMLFPIRYDGNSTNGLLRNSE